MPLVPFRQLLDDARRGGYAVGYFEAWDSYSLEAVLEAAELERSQVPVSLLLNEAHSLAHGLRGIEAGFNAVMLATSEAEPIAALARIAHEREVEVEGELGSLPDGNPEGEIDESHASRTDPDRAAAFVRATRVDALAVSIGNVHTLETSLAEIDLGLLAEIERVVEVPLVLHGGTSFPAEAVPGAIARGVAKFNVGTTLKRAYLEGLSEAAASVPDGTSPHALIGSHKRSDLLEAAKPQLLEKVRSLTRLYGSAGRAA